MISLYKEGVYLLNGTEIIPESEASRAPQLSGEQNGQEEARHETITYGILKSHNTSGDMNRLRLKFDSMTSHDITFVGVIQTARASGMERFPLPYVLTNCHNSLCAVEEPSMRTTTCSGCRPARSTAEYLYRPTSRSCTSTCGR